MPNSKRRCVGCKNYFPVAQLLRGNVCSEECRRDLYRRRSPRPQTPMRTGTSTLQPTLRERIIKRDRDRCRRCGTAHSLHVHHIDYRSQGGPDEEWNLITLCDGCHAEVHTDKRRYQPLLRAYIWLVYVERRKLSVLQIERWLSPEPRFKGPRRGNSLH